MAEKSITTENPLKEEAVSETVHDKILLNWKAPEFIIHQKGKTWFLIAGIITLILIIYAIYTNSATMAIVFIVLAGVYYLTHNQHPKIIDISITELGVFVDKNFYPYNMINSFWIVYSPPYVHNLYLRLSGKTFTKIVIQLDVQDPVEVRRALGKEIPEVEGESESFGEILIRMLRL
jgi:sulfur relay (sulfurtransferase) DsrF/TusC family protein